MLIGSDLCWLKHQEEIRLTRWYHGTENFRTETNVTSDGASSLAHPLDFALLHIEPSPQGDIREDVRSCEHTLAAKAGNDNVSYFVGHLQADLSIRSVVARRL